MWTINLRLGIAELLLAASLVFLAGLFTLFAIKWPLGFVPALSYGVATLGTYAGYRLYVREKQQDAGRETAAAGNVAPAARFRIVDTLGSCPLGRRMGEVIAVGPGGPTAPLVCPEAEAVLRIAAADGNAVKQWCCPVYDHMLVLEKETVAA